VKQDILKRKPSSTAHGCIAIARIQKRTNSVVAQRLSSPKPRLGNNFRAQALNRPHAWMRIFRDLIIFRDTRANAHYSAPCEHGSGGGELLALGNN
jgi:hypothetical protein